MLWDKQFILSLSSWLCFGSVWFLRNYFFSSKLPNIQMCKCEICSIPLLFFLWLQGLQICSFPLQVICSFILSFFLEVFQFYAFFSILIFLFYVLFLLFPSFWLLWVYCIFFLKVIHLCSMWYICLFIYNIVCFSALLYLHQTYFDILYFYFVSVLCI